MIVDRSVLFDLMGLGGRFGAGSHLLMETEDGGHRASASWNEDGLSVDITEAVEGEAGSVVLSFSGPYLLDDDSFDLNADDRRIEASARNDPMSAANAFRNLTDEMREIR